MSGMIDGDLRQSGSRSPEAAARSPTGEVYYLKLTFDESRRRAQVPPCTCRDFLAGRGDLGADARPRERSICKHLVGLGRKSRR